MDSDPTSFDTPLSKRPLILSRACKTFYSNTASDIVAGDTEIILQLPLMSETGLSCHAKLPETATCEAPADRGMPTAPRLSLSPCSKSHSEDLTDSPVTLLCCESLGSLSDVEASVDVAAFQAALGQTFNLVPVEVVSDEPTGCFLDESGPNEGEHISVYEHSYCRPDTDRDQLWNKILSLHAKILELGRREESTVAKIQALESEIALLKRDGAVFKEKQKVLEDYISSVLL